MDIEISTHISEDGTRTARVKKNIENKYVVIFEDSYRGFTTRKVYSHLQLAEDQAEDFVL